MIDVFDLRTAHAQLFMARVYREQGRRADAARSLKYAIEARHAYAATRFATH